MQIPLIFLPSDDRKPPSRKTRETAIFITGESAEKGLLSLFFPDITPELILI
jgi:hypothetical protein